MTSNLEFSTQPNNHQGSRKNKTMFRYGKLKIFYFPHALSRGVTGGCATPKRVCVRLQRCVCVVRQGRTRPRTQKTNPARGRSRRNSQLMERTSSDDSCAPEGVTGPGSGRSEGSRETSLQRWTHRVSDVFKGAGRMLGPLANNLELNW